MILINPHARFDFVTADEMKLPEAQRTTLILRPLNGARFVDCARDAEFDGERLLWSGRQLVAIVTAGLIDWRRPDGEAFPGAAVVAEAMDAGTLKATAARILKLAELDEAARKNSASGPASSPAPSSTCAPGHPAPGPSSS